ncbi:MAG: molybdate ABC transporter substrate-binding protein [Solimonas sp.]
MPISIRHALFALALLCGYAQATQAGEIRVYAAASLTDAMTELGDAYARTAAGTTVKPVFAASSTLAKQIEAGAPADVFVSADRKWMDYLQSRERIAGTPADLLGNALVLIAPQGHGFKVRFEPGFAIGDAFEGRLCTGEPGVVPVGIYAKEALGKLGWWDTLQKRIVGTDDVRAALAFVERGECAAGIVYASDAAISKKVEVTGTFPDDTHAPIVYPAGLVKGGSAEAQGFVDFLRTPQAARTFERYGFVVLKR